MAPSTLSMAPGPDRADRPRPSAAAEPASPPARAESAAGCRRIRSRSLGAKLAVLAGLGLMAPGAAVAFGHLRADRRTGAAAPSSARDAAAAFPQVGVVRQTYEAGHSSGWHVHPGVHSAVVLSGTLTVYDQDCRRQDYGPGDAYLGGASPHLARNEGSQALELAVTYVFATTAAGPGSPVSAPAGCEER